MTVDVAVHHEGDQVVVLERAQQLAEAVLGRDGVDRELGLGLTHGGREPAAQLNAGDRVEGVAPVREHHGRQLPVAEVGGAQDDSPAARDGGFEVLAARDLNRAQQLAARQVREAEELEQHAVVAVHHMARDLHALAARRAWHGAGEVGERGVAAGGEKAQMGAGQHARQEVTQAQRHAGDQSSQPAEHQS